MLTTNMARSFLAGNSLRDRPRNFDFLGDAPAYTGATLLLFGHQVCTAFIGQGA